MSDLNIDELIEKFGRNYPDWLNRSIGVQISSMDKTLKTVNKNIGSVDTNIKSIEKTSKESLAEEKKLKKAIDKLNVNMEKLANSKTNSVENKQIKSELTKLNNTMEKLLKSNNIGSLEKSLKDSMVKLDKSLKGINLIRPSAKNDQRIDKLIITLQKMLTAQSRPVVDNTSKTTKENEKATEKQTNSIKKSTNENEKLSSSLGDRLKLEREYKSSLRVLNNDISRLGSSLRDNNLTGTIDTLGNSIADLSRIVPGLGDMFGGFISGATAGIVALANEATKTQTAFAEINRTGVRMSGGFLGVRDAAHAGNLSLQELSRAVSQNATAFVALGAESGSIFSTMAMNARNADSAFRRLGMTTEGINEFLSDNLEYQRLTGRLTRMSEAERSRRAEEEVSRFARLSAAYGVSMQTLQRGAIDFAARDETQLLSLVLDRLDASGGASEQLTRFRSTLQSAQIEGHALEAMTEAYAQQLAQSLGGIIPSARYSESSAITQQILTPDLVRLFQDQNTTPGQIQDLIMRNLESRPELLIRGLNPEGDPGGEIILSLAGVRGRTRGVDPTVGESATDTMLETPIDPAAQALVEVEETFRTINATAGELATTVMGLDKTQEILSGVNSNLSEFSRILGDINFANNSIIEMVQQIFGIRSTPDTGSLAPTTSPFPQARPIVPSDTPLRTEITDGIIEMTPSVLEYLRSELGVNISNDYIGLRIPYETFDNIIGDLPPERYDQVTNDLRDLHFKDIENEVLMQRLGEAQPMAKGGVAVKSLFANIAEAGSPEMVLPLDPALHDMAKYIAEQHVEIAGPFYRRLNNELIYSLFRNNEDPIDKIFTKSLEKFLFSKAEIENTFMDLQRFTDTGEELTPEMRNRLAIMGTMGIRPSEFASEWTPRSVGTGVGTGVGTDGGTPYAGVAAGGGGTRNDTPSSGLTPEIQAELLEFAERNNINPNALAGVLSIESGLDPSRQGGASNRFHGIFQLQDTQIPGLTEQVFGRRMTPEQYRRLSFAQQLQVYQQYISNSLRGMSPSDFFTGDAEQDASRLWALQLAPSNARSINYDDPTSVISRTNQANAISARRGLVTVGSVRGGTLSRGGLIQSSPSIPTSGISSGHMKFVVQGGIYGGPRNQGFFGGHGEGYVDYSQGFRPVWDNNPTRSPRTVTDNTHGNPNGAVDGRISISYNTTQISRPNGTSFHTTTDFVINNNTGTYVRVSLASARNMASQIGARLATTEEAMLIEQSTTNRREFQPAGTPNGNNLLDLIERHDRSTPPPSTPMSFGGISPSDSGLFITPETRAQHPPSANALNISMDFNASPHGNARGTGVIIPDGSGPEVYGAARMFNEEVANFARRHGISDYPIRGIRTRSQNGRGVRHTIHTEPFFNTDLEIQRIIQQNPLEFAEIYTRAFGGLDNARLIAPHGVGADRGATSQIFGSETEFGQLMARTLLSRQPPETPVGSYPIDPTPSQGPTLRLGDPEQIPTTLPDDGASLNSIPRAGSDPIVLAIGRQMEREQRNHRELLEAIRTISSIV